MEKAHSDCPHPRARMSHKGGFHQGALIAQAVDVGVGPFRDRRLFGCPP